jgi:hypothetical protein
MSSLISCLVLILMFCLAFTLVLRLALFHVLCLALLLVLHLSSLMDLTITHMVLVHERTALCLDALNTAHVLIVIIVSRVGLFSLLEGLTLTLSWGIWLPHVFPVVVHVPLGQMVSWKGLWRLLLVVWLSAGFLRFISLTPAWSHRPLLVLCRWWMEAWWTRGSWIPVAHISWLESLYGSPTSPTCFRVSDSCVIWHVAFMCAWLVLVVIGFLIALTLMSPSWDLMDYLTPFHVGWDVFVNMLIELLCWFTILFLWCFFWFFLCWSLESLSPFCSNDHTCSFRRAYISWHVSKGVSKISFSNQILHLANPHDKLSAFVFYPSLGFPSIYWLTLWDPRLGHISLSCHM